ncbi:hypothetical protein D046_8421B, partial [Vibrio parahaemolyticus V-223/04]
PGEPIAMYG